MLIKLFFIIFLFFASAGAQSVSSSKKVVLLILADNHSQESQQAADSFTHYFYDQLNSKEKPLLQKVYASNLTKLNTYLDPSWQVVGAVLLAHGSSKLIDLHSDKHAPVKGGDFAKILSSSLQKVSMASDFFVYFFSCSLGKSTYQKNFQEAFTENFYALTKKRFSDFNLATIAFLRTVHGLVHSTNKTKTSDGFYGKFQNYISKGDDPLFQNQVIKSRWKRYNFLSIPTWFAVHSEARLITATQNGLIKGPTDTIHNLLANNVFNRFEAIKANKCSIFFK